jgi:MOSC domain-containing protein YiiM
MSWRGSVASIHIGEKGKALRVVESVEARAGVGLIGDRYGAGAGLSKKQSPDREITLIETEAVEALEREYDIKITPAESRRSVATRGVPLNHLVGKTFRVGPVLIRGIRLCEPCGHLEKLLKNNKIREGLAHRGGLRAQILSDGMIRAGDVVESAE